MAPPIYDPVMRSLTVAKASMIVLAVPATALCFGYLVMGLSFGLNLWRADRPFAIALWFAVVLFPLFIANAMSATKTPRQFWIMTGMAWSFAAFWVYHNFIWMPWTYGGPWGW